LSLAHPSKLQAFHTIAYFYFLFSLKNKRIRKISSSMLAAVGAINRRLGRDFFCTTRAAVYSSDKKKVAEVIKKYIRKFFFPSSQGKNRRKI
jgi:hypothetical protein